MSNMAPRDALATIEEVLGEPYSRAENCLLFDADCLGAMRKLPDGILNLTVTSPPYNMARSTRRHGL